MGWFKRARDSPVTFADDETALAYPYYVDAEGLRGLADSVGLELPLTRELKRERKLSIKLKEAGAEGTRGEVRLLAGQIHLNGLAVALRRQVSYDQLSDNLGFVPFVSDRSVLDGAIAHMEAALGAHSQTSELLQQLRGTYDAERAKAIAASKREELRAVAEENKLVLLRGQFRLCEVGPSGECTIIELSHLEAFGFSGLAEDSSEYQEADVPVPEGLHIQAVLPDGNVFTSSGRERLLRREPFYGQVIAHSPSYADSDGKFTCSAYAVWGMTRSSIRRSRAGGIA